MFKWLRDILGVTHKQELYEIRMNGLLTDSIIDALESAGIEDKDIKEIVIQRGVSERVLGFMLTTFIGYPHLGMRLPRSSYITIYMVPGEPTLTDYEIKQVIRNWLNPKKVIDLREIYNVC